MEAGMVVADAWQAQATATSVSPGRPQRCWSMWPMCFALVVDSKLLKTQGVFC